MQLDHLTDELHRAASDVALRPGSAAHARAVGRRRRARRRQAGVAATAVVAVTAGGVGLRQLTRDTGPQVSSGESPATTPPSAVPTPSNELRLALTDPALVWTRVDPDSVAAVGRVRMFNQLVATPAMPGAMVSTAPGRDDAAAVVWTSQDGVTWTQTGGMPPGDATAAAAATVGNRVYVAGTQPGVADPHVDARISVSDDGGATWAGQDLPVDDPALAATLSGFPVMTSVSSVAATDRLVLVVTRQGAAVTDWDGYFRRVGLDPDARMLVPAPEGVNAWDCDPEVDMSCGAGTPEVTPWADLGPLGAVGESAVRLTPRLFASVDGGEFVEIAAPAGGAGADTMSAYTLGQEIVLTSTIHETVTGEGRSTTWRTTDGATWSEFAVPNAYAPVAPLGAGLVGIDDGMGAVYLDPDGAGWRSGLFSDLAGPDEVLQMNGTWTSSAAGVTVAVGVGDGGDGEQPVATSAVPAPTVDTIAQSGGAPMPTTTMVGMIAGPRRFEILHSADGVNWSRESIADLAGVDESDVASVTRVQAAGNTVVVAVSLTEAQANGVPKQLVLVGTPRG